MPSKAHRISFLKYLAVLRPQEWIKNGFVFVGILFANLWREPNMIERVSVTALAFSLTASGVYVLNDLLDRDQDRNHPRKRERPIAAQHIAPRSALLLMTLLWFIGLGLGWIVGARVVLILGMYIAINLAYSVAIRNIVILDVFAIASGFMLRILAGTVGVGIPPSQWLLLCGLMIALFLGFSKRRAELYASTGDGDAHRPVLNSYHPVLLDKMIVVTATCVVVTYGLYTMSPVTMQTHGTEALIYTLPFVMYGIFRYMHSLHKQTSGTDPSREIFRDPHVLLSILGWLLVTLWLIS
ncbi:MAG TPA: decaprenyl-phosphate phosphoribosyltransferase [Pyrinomonadaceae bacterium]|nr:decaprenyl-phosphate phosphoribosyltransferase [Pyrinomonadaceae bacterium]